MDQDVSILLAEDDESDVMLLRRAFKDADISNPLHIARDGDEAVRFLSAMRDNGKAPFPALIILDLKMPLLDGVATLKWIREQPVINRLSVVIFSSSAQPIDIEAAYEEGADGFFVKPSSIVQRRELARLLKEWLARSEPPMAALRGFRAAAELHRPKSMARHRRSGK